MLKTDVILPLIQKLLAVNTSGTPRVDLERLHVYSLVENSLKVWRALTKALENEKKYNGNSDRYWVFLRSMAGANENCSRNTRSSVYQGKKEFGSLEIEVSEHVAKYFARLHVILMKLTRHQVSQ